ncbi:AI-2E family transporter [Allorhizocola rhizosphaerae]|uniref:AI-2E family transporter n=1 Tax=Allorhizocola rhizosphaerae TaxID=1872709 RepID=UPI000E3E233C|nr:AI-2E family transporter [Allorhizocola rhizosphaerae]
MGRFDQIRANIRRAYDAGRASVRAAREEEERQSADPGPPPVAPPEPELTHSSTSSLDDTYVPQGLRVASAWAWRMIVVSVAVIGLLWLVGKLTIVVIPLAIALLLAALLGPAVNRMRRFGIPRSLATTIAVIGGLAAVVGTFTLVIREFVQGLDELTVNARQGLDRIEEYLKTGPLQLTDLQLTNLINQIREIVTKNQDRLTDLGLTTATTAVEIVSGTFLVLFALFFFLRDGRQIWRFSLNLVPVAARENVDQAGLAAWRSLVSYVRATVLVAFIDAVGIGILLTILQVPLALPLAALVFLMAFIPIIGATLSGAVAVLVALVTNGPVTALVVLGGVIAVQQIEGHLLQPLIMGRAVAIHPLAVIVGIAGGLILGGIIGALIAVPIIAVLNTGIRRLNNPASRAGTEDAVVVKSPGPKELL